MSQTAKHTPAVLTPRAIEALLWARDHGSAWRYQPGKSLPWSAARTRMLNKLCKMGLLTGSDQITEAGLALLDSIAKAEGRS